MIPGEPPVVEAPRVLLSESQAVQLLRMRELREQADGGDTSARGTLTNYATVGIPFAQEVLEGKDARYDLPPIRTRTNQTPPREPTRELTSAPERKETVQKQQRYIKEGNYLLGPGEKGQQFYRIVAIGPVEEGYLFSGKTKEKVVVRRRTTKTDVKLPLQKGEKVFGQESVTLEDHSGKRIVRSLSELTHELNGVDATATEKWTSLWNQDEGSAPLMTYLESAYSPLGAKEDRGEAVRIAKKFMDKTGDFKITPDVAANLYMDFLLWMTKADGHRSSIVPRHEHQFSDPVWYSINAIVLDAMSLRVNLDDGRAHVLDEFLQYHPERNEQMRGNVHSRYQPLIYLFQQFVGR